jgi:cell division protein FtsZ
MNIELVESETAQAKIRVIGVGGAGGNAVNSMITSGMSGVDFAVVNTDAQDLSRSLAPRRYQLGVEITKGLGAGARPNIGREAAYEDKEALAEMVRDCDMVFITAGMGGGTGTGAAPVLAEIAKEADVLTVGVVTRPFGFEGKQRKIQANEGIDRLRSCVDTLITIPNQRLVSIAHENTTLRESFETADLVLQQAVRGVADLINAQGHINVDFADVRTIMKDNGDALMGIGISAGPKGVVEAAKLAVSSPLLDEVSLSGASSVLVSITAASNVSIFSVNEAISMIEEEAHEDANVIFGLVEDNSLQDEVQVTVIATGFNKEEAQRQPVEHQMEAVVNGNNHFGNYSQTNYGQNNNAQGTGQSYEQVGFQRNNGNARNQEPINRSIKIDDYDFPTFFKNS